MGIATNQIATKGDLMKGGFTEISTSITDTECVTYGDLKQLHDTGGMRIGSSLYSTINHSDSEAPSGMNSIAIDAGETLTFKIAVYNIPHHMYLSATNHIELGHSNAGVSVSNVGTGSYVNLHYAYALCRDSDGPISSVDTIGDSVTIAPGNGANLVWYFTPRTVATNIGNDTTLYLYLLVTNQSTYVAYLQFDWGQITSSNLALKYIPLNKCIKYSEAMSKYVYKSWYFGINESVAGKTKANNISVRYAYKTASTATETYVNAASCALSDPDAANGTFSASIPVQHNPRKLVTTAPYSSRLTIWCGSTNSNQSWSYRVRKRNGVWTSWCSQPKAKSAYVDPLKDFPELLNSNPYSSLSGGDAAWLQAIYAINGVEFKIT